MGMSRKLLIVLLVSLQVITGLGGSCDCPPSPIFLETKGTILSQKAVCSRTCYLTILANNISDVVLFTFTHIPSTFNVTIYDANNPDPNRILKNCKSLEGNQCYSNGNEVTFEFSSDWQEQTSTGEVELFALSTSKEHAAALVKTETKIVKTWEIWIVVGVVLVFLTVIAATSFIALYLYRRKKAKEAIRTMQSCMIYASSNPVLQKYDVW